jgi:hypothetical protein
MMRPMMFFALAMFAVAVPARAGSTADEAKARALLDAAKAAMGGSAWDQVAAIHMTQSIETCGLKGTTEAWAEVKTGQYADTYVLGPSSGAEGWNGKIYWTKDDSGQVRPEAGGESVISAKTEAYRQALAYWYPQRAKASLTYLGQKSADKRVYDVVRVIPEGGRNFEIWIDSETHRIERTVEKKEIDTVTVTFSDWRVVHGVSVPYAEQSSIGQPKYDQFLKITSIEFPQTISAEQFAQPAPPPPDFALGADHVTVPFQLNNNHIYVEAKVNGKPVTVVFDTGATNYLHTESLARLGLKAEGALPGAGVGESKEDTGIVKIDTVEIGGLTVKKQVFAVASSAGWPAIEGVDSDGLLGYEVVKRVPTAIDYEREQMTFYRPGSFQGPTAAKPIAFRFAEHIPEIDGSIDGLAARMHIDTGSRATIDLTGPFVEKNKLVEKYAPRYEATTGWGVGGAARARLARAHTLALGDQIVQEPVIELTSQTKGAFASAYYDGNVGGEILRRFTLTLDYAHQKLWLERNGLASKPFAFDRSGMFLAVDGDAFVIKDVTAKGPAAAAGLKAGDHIVQINGKSPKDWPLPRLREWLKTTPAGTTLSVRLSGGAGVSLKLEDLI